MRKIELVIAAALLSGLACTASAITATEGQVTLTIKTKTTGRQFAPRHVLAIWVEDSQGKFVRTLKYQAKAYRMYLVEWNKITRKEKTPLVDAVTGASLRKHEVHTVTWDGKDSKGQVVPDGFYHIRVEFSEKNGKGPATPPRHIRFLKGPKPMSVKPRPLAYFKDIVLEYKPDAPKEGT
jgi:hypothetical protein